MRVPDLGQQKLCWDLSGSRARELSSRRATARTKGGILIWFKSRLNEESQHMGDALSVTSHKTDKERQSETGLTLFMVRP